MQKMKINQCPYTSRLQKGGASLEDMRHLVRTWGQCGNAEQRQQILTENVLGKKTRMRAHDVFSRLFSLRFLKGDPPEAWKIVRPLEDLDPGVEIIRPVYYWITSRSDRLLYDYVTLELFGRAGSPDQMVRPEEAAFWIKKVLEEYDQAWTDTVAIKVARGLLAALRDFGILEGKATKKIAPLYLPIESFAYLAFTLSRQDFSAEQIIRHPDWRLFLLAPVVVEHLCLEAHQRKLMNYEAAGNLYRIDFPAQNWEEMAHVIMGRTTQNS